MSDNGASAKPGRDHHKDAFTMWLAGGGVRDGAAVGTADDFGFSPVEMPVHVHDLNATVCTCSGWITRSSPASTRAASSA